MSFNPALVTWMKLPDLSDTLVVFGLLLFVAGVGWVYPPAGLIVLGAALFLIGYRAQ